MKCTLLKQNIELEIKDDKEHDNHLYGTAFVGFSFFSFGISPKGACWKELQIAKCYSDFCLL